MEITCALRVIGYDLNPDAVSQQLQVEPTEAHRRGDGGGGPRAPQAWKQGVWILASGRDRTSSLEDHIVALLDVLEPRQNAVRQLSVDGHSVDVFVGVFLAEDNESVTLEPAELARMGALGAALVLDVYR